MPYVNIKITREGATHEQKAELIAGVTDLLVRVLDKNPATTFVVIDEVDLENWGVGGLPVKEYRREHLKTGMCRAAIADARSAATRTVAGLTLHLQGPPEGARRKEE